MKFQVFPRHLGFFPYLWLVYLSLPIYNLAANESGWKLYIGYMMVGVFLVTYRQLYFAEDKRSFFPWLLLQMLIIFIFCMSYSSAYLLMGFFTANFIGWYTDKREFMTAFVLFMMVELIPLIYHVEDIWNSDLLYTLPFMVIMLLSPFGIRSMISRQKLEKELAQANEQIRNLIKGEERMRIARDLHDTLGHTLSLITLKSQLVEKLVDVNIEQARLEAKEIQNTSRAALRQVRELVSDMRTATLAEELREAQVILQSANIQLTHEGNPRFEGIPDTAHNIMSLCLREAITNVVKHSEASKCHVSFEQSEGEWRLSVKDNGIGRPSSAESQTREKNGLKGMAERLALVDGNMRIMAKEGMLLTVRVPIVITNRKEREA
ncbi:sensor histidine kinase [Paenibacillus dakarensis]|uniref:sensor histidine kinase n=1 Tax=Paenibacillus dakarensis TaxID=1527293 RepID=UPI0006D53733|nr:sensor histidine kinase [Paenibacillus dakarensis]